MGLTRRQLLKRAIYGLVTAVIPMGLVSMPAAAEVEELCRCGRSHGDHKFDEDVYLERAAEQMRVQIDRDILESFKKGG